MRATLLARVYAANTLGAIAGALSAGMLLIAWVGSQRTQQLLIVLSISSGLLLLLSSARIGRRAGVAISIAAVIDRQSPDSERSATL